MKKALKLSIPLKALSLALFFVVGAAAQENPLAVIGRSVQAMGGQRELAGIRNIRALADCVGPRGKYSTEIYSARNSRLVFKQVRQQGGRFLGQVNGRVFWTLSETDEPSLADQKEAYVWRSHEFQWLAMAPLERFREPSFEGYESFAGKSAAKLLVKDELGRPAHLFFDPDSGLMLGFIILNPFSRQPESIRTVFNEWKQVGKVKLPSVVTATDRQGDYVLNFQDMAVNRINESIFSVPAKVTAMNELLELHNKARDAHFNRDAKALVSTFADDYADVSDGKIQRPPRESIINRMQSYFENSTFLEWDDITAPDIRVSDDATMGYVIVHKKVRRLAKSEAGSSREEQEVFAWVALYRKMKGQWKLTAVVSTRTPEREPQPSTSQ